MVSRPSRPDNPPGHARHHAVRRAASKRAPHVEAHATRRGGDPARRCPQRPRIAYRRCIDDPMTAYGLTTRDDPHGPSRCSGRRRGHPRYRLTGGVLMMDPWNLSTTSPLRRPPTNLRPRRRRCITTWRRPRRGLGTAAAADHGDPGPLRRDVHHRILGGVAAGVAQYLGIDAAIVRSGVRRARHLRWVGGTALHGGLAAHSLRPLRPQRRPGVGGPPAAAPRASW